MLDLLLRNREKLLTFMKRFQTERNDEQFAEEKKFIITKIEELSKWSTQLEAPRQQVPLTVHPSPPVLPPAAAPMPGPVPVASIRQLEDTEANVRLEGELN